MRRPRTGRPSEPEPLREPGAMPDGIAEQVLDRLRAPEVQVAVELPAEADPAVDLHALGRGALLRDRVLLQLAVQGLAIEAQVAARERLVAADGAQHLEDVLALELLERDEVLWVAIQQGSGRPPHALGQVLLRSGDARASVETMRRIRAIEQKQGLADPTMLRWHSDLASGLVAIGELDEAAETIRFARDALANRVHNAAVNARLDRAEALLHRLSAEEDTQRSVAVRVHESIPGPMTYGVLRPVIMLPLDATAWSNNAVRCTL